MAGRFSGKGLCDALRQERAAVRQAKRQAYRKGRRRAVPEDVADDVPDETSGAALVEGRKVVPSAACDRQERALPDLSALTIPDLEQPGMIERLYKAFEGQMESMEARLRALVAEAGSPASLADIDKTVKTLASLAKTLGVLIDLKQASTEEAEEEGDGLAKDADALRAQLAERLGRLCEGGAH
ncbi:hypothetical protein [Roseibium litorale]|uniref:Uncharacterized protein n=1 Tax=Roseibium litorale TaxID=2803841 RepID=A0ABR9CRK0_9HYPH|nr:hypothetical protein [Roseibium litorale]MBD8893505.1 hypothetical protein [Roseibium litorale]